MKNEAEFKSIFKKSIKAHKGFSLSLAAPMVVGIPDLYVVIPGYIPILLEAKWLGDIKKPTFKRKINYSPLQQNFLNECNRVNNYSAFGLIGFKYQSFTYAVMTPCHVTTLTQDFENLPYAVYSSKSKIFELQGLIDNWGVPEIKYNTYLEPCVRNKSRVDLHFNDDKMDILD